MTTRLWLIDLALLALLGLGIWQVRRNYLSAAMREQAFLNQRAKAEPVVAPLIPPPPAPVTGAQYLEVASQLLLSKDRNPNVVIDVEPSKVQPPFPRFYGAMDFGDGVRVVLSEKPGAPQKSYKLGDQIGEFKILAVSRSGMDFEWDGKRLTARMAELKDTTPIQETTTAAPSTPAAAQSSPSTTIIGGNAATPGVEIATDTKGCQSGDTSPAGSVVDGYRKVVSQTPFGNSCRWERLK